MSASVRRAVASVVAATGVVLVVLGAWVAVVLGPTGAAQFSASSNAPGAIVVPPEVLNAVDVPVRVTATRRDGGVVLLAAAPSSDARQVLATSAASTVSAVHFPAQSLDLRAAGVGALPDISTADVWRLSARGKSSAALLVGQGWGPETAVVASGDATALGGVSVTLTWVSRAWFFEALAAATIGAVLAAFALSDLWQGRAIAMHSGASENPAPSAPGAAA